MKYKILEIKRHAHIAATLTAITNYSPTDWCAPIEKGIKYYEYKDKKTNTITYINAQLRKDIKNDLKEAGFPAFLSTETQPVVPVACGRKNDDDGWGWYDWILFDLNELKEYVKYFDETLDEDCIINLTPFYSYYNGSGRPFTHDAVVRIKRNRVFVTQRGGYDI